MPETSTSRPEPASSCQTTGLKQAALLDDDTYPGTSWGLRRSVAIRCCYFWRFVVIQCLEGFGKTCYVCSRVQCIWYRCLVQRQQDLQLDCEGFPDVRVSETLAARAGLGWLDEDESSVFSLVARQCPSHCAGFLLVESIEAFLNNCPRLYAVHPQYCLQLQPGSGTCCWRFLAVM